VVPNPHPTVRSAQLPEQLQSAMQSEIRLHRQGAVSELARLLKSPDPAIAMSAEIALRKMVNDDSKSVADFAQDVLNQHFRIEAVNIQHTPAQEAALPKSSLKESAVDTTSNRIAVTNTAPKVTQVSQTSKKKNANLGGFLNVIIPGAAQAYAGNWGRAIVTFIVVAVFLYTIVSMGSDSICVSLWIIEVIYMFLVGRNIIVKYNKKISGEK